MPDVTTLLARWWGALLRPDAAGRLVLDAGQRRGLNPLLALLVALLYGGYGVSMGLFHSPTAAMVSALKLPLLFLLTFGVALPGIYVINAVLGPRLTARSCVTLLLLATSVNALVLASYAPISFFFTLTTSRTVDSGYPFLVLMHVVVFVAAGLLSAGAIVYILRATSRALGQSAGPVSLGVIIALYAFVGAQMAWVLRPWVGAPNAPYQFVRPFEGNIIEGVWRLLAG
jgi:hypothetical protein